MYLVDVLIVITHNVSVIYKSLLQCCIITVVKQRTSQRRLYTVAYVIARATLKCGCYLAILNHLRWLYGAEWERTATKRVRLSCGVLSHGVCA